MFRNSCTCFVCERGKPIRQRRYDYADKGSNRRRLAKQKYVFPQRKFLQLQRFFLTAPLSEIKNPICSDNRFIRPVRQRSISDQELLSKKRTWYDSDDEVKGGPRNWTQLRKKTIEQITPLPN